MVCGCGVIAEERSYFRSALLVQMGEATMFGHRSRLNRVLSAASGLCRPNSRIDQ